MTRRRIASLLVAILALTGVAACPRAMESCLSAVATPSHDCCGDDGMLTAARCCCDRSYHSQSRAEPGTHVDAPQPPAALASQAVAPVNPPAAAVAPSQSDGPDPPPSLFRQRVSLLL